jgi:hypothetical protein
MSAENFSIAAGTGGKKPDAIIMFEITRRSTTPFKIDGRCGHNIALISVDPKRAIIPGAFRSRSLRIADVAATSSS